MVGKVMMARYYWLHALKDVEESIRKCSKCQMHAMVAHCLLEELTLIVSPWSFAQWRVDLVGPLHKEE